MKTLNRILLLVLLINLSCTGRVDKKNDVVQADAIPANAIPFEYDEKQQRAILLKGNLNDTIPINLFFDTGMGGNRIFVSDSLKNCLGDDSCTVQIGNSLSLQQKLFYIDNDNFFIKYFGQNTAHIGWDFFDNKIIKISYQQKYIQILDSTEGLGGYTCLPFNYLGIEIEVFVQEKHIKEFVCIDTGFNGFVLFNNNIIEKYAINMDNAQRIQTLDRSLRQYRLNADSINAGCVLSGKQTVEFLAEMNPDRYAYSEILGNAFLENFEIILDFKEFKMYIKPNSVLN